MHLLPVPIGINEFAVCNFGRICGLLYGFFEIDFSVEVDVLWNRVCRLWFILVRVASDYLRRAFIENGCQ
jgi:hypothetical protein